MECKSLFSLLGGTVLLLGFLTVCKRDIASVLAYHVFPNPAVFVKFVKFVQVYSTRNHALEYFDCAVLLATTGFMNLDQTSAIAYPYWYRLFSILSMTLALESILLSRYYETCLHAVQVDPRRIIAWIVNAESTMSEVIFSVPAMLSLVPALSIWAGISFIGFRLVYAIGKASEEPSEYPHEMDADPTMSLFMTCLICGSFALTVGSMRRFSQLGRMHGDA